MKATHCIYEPVVLWCRNPDDISPKNDTAFTNRLPVDRSDLYIGSGSCCFKHNITVGVPSLGNNFVNFQKVVQVANRLLVFSQMYNVDDGMGSCGAAAFGSVFESKVVHLDIDTSKAKSLVEDYKEGRLEIIELIAGASKSAAAYTPKHGSHSSSINPETPVIFAKNKADFDHVCQEAAQQPQKFDQMIKNGKTDEYKSENYYKDIITVKYKSATAIASEKSLLDSMKEPKGNSNSRPSKSSYLNSLKEYLESMGDSQGNSELMAQRIACMKTLSDDQLLEMYDTLFPE